MKTLAILVMILMATTVWAQEEVKHVDPSEIITPEPFTVEEIAAILEEADRQMTEKNCTPMYLNTVPPYIWVKCAVEDGQMKYKILSLKPLIDLMRKRKAEKAEEKPPDSKLQP